MALQNNGLARRIPAGEGGEMIENNKRPENMWCFNCEYEWFTDDYFNCNECPKCNQHPIYRTSSTSFFYAYLSKHPDKNAFNNPSTDGK